MKSSYNYQKVGIDVIQHIYEVRFKELHTFLMSNNIKYFAIGGTLLGAIRHKGLIPWDDDMDIGMLRHDYEVFLTLLSKLNKEHFVVYGCRTNNKIVEHGLIKIGLVGTYQDANLKKKFSHEYHIDVFPYDNVPNDEQLRKKIEKQQIKIKKALHLKSQKHSSSNSFIKNILLCFYQIATCFRPVSALAKRLDSLGRSTKDLDSIFITNLMGTYSYQREMIKKDFIGEPFITKFGSTEIYIPQYYDLFLTSVYGADYMTPKDIRNDIQQYFGFADEKLLKNINEQKHN